MHLLRPPALRRLPSPKYQQSTPWIMTSALPSTRVWDTYIEYVHLNVTQESDIAARSLSKAACCVCCAAADATMNIAAIIIRIRLILSVKVRSYDLFKFIQSRHKYLSRLRALLRSYDSGLLQLVHNPTCPCISHA